MRAVAERLKGSVRMLHPPSSDPRLRVEATHFDGGVLLVVSGEVDLSTIPLLDAELSLAAFSADVVVDLSDVTFLGAVGIRTLLHVAAEQRSTGHTLHIGAIRPQHHRLLRRLGVLAELRVTERREPPTPTRADGR